jgi:FKBP-type peptidyl-prolyl cis-trans isomerase
MHLRKGVVIEDLCVGHGPEATSDARVRVHYDGFLNRGDLFQRDVECEIDLRAREVIAGLRYGLVGMRPGGRRRIRVSPHLAYGDRGVPGLVPPNAVLVFEVELLEVRRAEPVP